MLFNKSLLSILFYMACSQGCVYTNKFILDSNQGKADAIFVTWFQNLVEFFLILIFSNSLLSYFHLQLFPPIVYTSKHFIAVFPCALLFVTTFLLNNKCMESIPLTSYQICRSLTILFNVLFSFLFLKKKTTIKEFLCCCGVTLGFIVGIEGDVNFSLKGMVFGVSSSMSLSLYSVFSRKCIDMFNGNQFILIEYIIPFSIIVLTPILIFDDGFNAFFEGYNLRFWFFQILGGILGTMINVASFICIKNTSPIIHCLAGTLNSCITSFVSYMFLEKKLSVVKIVGSCMIIFFTFLYGILHSKVDTTKLQIESEDNQLLIEKNEENNIAV